MHTLETDHPSCLGDQRSGALSIFVLGTYVQACCLEVAHLPQPGESVLATALQQEPGGKGLNVAVGLHRLGWDVSALFPVGEDEPGNALAKVFELEGMAGTRCVALGPRSGFGIGLIGADGQNCVVVHPGANALIEARHVDQLASLDIARSHWLYASFELSRDAVRAALTLARASGSNTVLNPSPFEPMDAGFWALCDGIVVNEAEAVALLELEKGEGVPWDTGWGAPQWVDWLKARAELVWGGHVWPGRWLVITLCERGAVMWQAGNPVCWAPGRDVAAVDTVGCGDAFLCGFLTVWSHTADAMAALHAGNACGAHLATHRGVLGALPRRAWLDDMAGIHTDR